MGCTRKDIQLVALQRSDDCRARFIAEVSAYDIWIDKSECDRRNCIRKWTYTIRGMTPRDHRLLIRGTRCSTTPVLSIDDLYLCEGTVNGETFADFVPSCLQSFIQPFNWINPHSVIIMDKASCNPPSWTNGWYGLWHDHQRRLQCLYTTHGGYQWFITQEALHRCTNYKHYNRWCFHSHAIIFTLLSVGGVSPICIPFLLHTLLLWGYQSHEGFVIHQVVCIV